MNYSRPTDRLVPTWALVTGTAKAGYGVANLNSTIKTIDPSLPLWIDETSIRIEADLGSALEVTAVAILNHTFKGSPNVRFQMHTTNSWGAPSVDEGFTLPTPYLDGYAVNLLLDLAAAIPSAGSRTFQWISIANLSASGVEVALGEVWVAGVGGWRQLSPYDLRHDYRQAQSHLVVEQTARRGVQMRYDLGARAPRIYDGLLRTTGAGLEELQDWVEDAHGAARTSLLSLDPSSTQRRDVEPRLVRLQGITVPVTIKHDEVYDVTVSFEELGVGEPIAAT